MQKAETHRLVDNLPDDATWNDLMHEIYVLKSSGGGSLTAWQAVPEV